VKRLMKVVLLSSVLGIVLAPSPARADGFFVPWAGVNFDNDPADGRGSYGFSAGYMGAGVFGTEFDFGYSPRFFGDDEFFGSNNVLTAMGNLILGIPIGGTTGGGFRPYFTGGVGLIRKRLRLECRWRFHGLLRRSRGDSRRPALFSQLQRFERRRLRQLRSRCGHVEVLEGFDRARPQVSVASGGAVSMRHISRQLLPTSSL
jgi:hypothetical protein